MSESRPRLTAVQQTEDSLAEESGEDGCPLAVIFFQLALQTFIVLLVQAD
jgi:hypothetical protein